MVKPTKKEYLVSGVKPTLDAYFRHCDLLRKSIPSLVKPPPLFKKTEFSLPTPDRRYYPDDEPVEEYCSECGRLIACTPKHIWQQTQWQHSK